MTPLEMENKSRITGHFNQDFEALAQFFGKILDSYVLCLHPLHHQQSERNPDVRNIRNGLNFRRKMVDFTAACRL